jgi:peptidoglycan/xylan/chitin deacetylase (PgdA/CDA1 family)
VTASFFILGRSAKIQPDTIRRIVREGHVIGNHTWDHKDLTKISIEAIHKQISDTDELIKKITNYDISFLRPPYGSYDDKLLKDINKTVILWNIDPEDWKDRDTELIIERMSQAEAGSIILAHDIYRTTIEAIPQLIKNLKQKGLQFVTVDKLFTPESLKGGQVLRHQ